MRISRTDVFVDKSGVHHKVTKVAGRRVEAVTRRGPRGNYTKAATPIPREALLEMRKVA